MPVAIITGAGGLIGSEAVDHFIGQGFDVVGIENDMRARFFGEEASTAHVTDELREGYSEFRSLDIDIRDAEGVNRAFADLAGSLDAVIHTAAQPSHDWAAREPQTDFGVNANGTLNLLDLMVYAVAKRTERPILCTGKDFTTTDADIHPASRRW